MAWMFWVRRLRTFSCGQKRRGWVWKRMSVWLMPMEWKRLMGQAKSSPLSWPGTTESRTCSLSSPRWPGRPCCPSLSPAACTGPACLRKTCCALPAILPPSSFCRNKERGTTKPDSKPGSPDLPWKPQSASSQRPSRKTGPKCWRPKCSQDLSCRPSQWAELLFPFPLTDSFELLQYNSLGTSSVWTWFIFSPLSPFCPTPVSFSFSFSSSSRTLFSPSLPWSFFGGRSGTAEPHSTDFDVLSKPPHFGVTCFCCLAIYKTHTGCASLSLSLAYLCPGRQADGGEAGQPLNPSASSQASWAYWDQIVPWSFEPGRWSISYHIFSCNRDLL